VDSNENWGSNYPSTDYLTSGSYGYKNPWATLLMEEEQKMDDSGTSKESKESKDSKESEKTDKPVSIRSSSGSSITTLVVLEEGTAVNALFEVDGWVFAEFDCMAGLVRAWIPADKVEAN